MWESLWGGIELAFLAFFWHAVYEQRKAHR